MVEREELMIVRKIYLNNCLPTIGAMFPQREDSENICCDVNLYYNLINNFFTLNIYQMFCMYFYFIPYFVSTFIIF